MLKNLSFEQLIIWCCKSDEIELRQVIKDNLTDFSIKEDDYIPYRSNYDIESNGISNMLLIRGNPKICLVAHTDVCRDHKSWQDNEPIKIPNPVIKELDGRKIIQDETMKTQVGGDDRLGVAICLWMALHTNRDIAILFTTDEEVGLKSANHVKFQELNKFDLLVQIDRGNASNQIVSTIKSIRLCNQDLVDDLIMLSVLSGNAREEVNGLRTDVFAIKQNGICKNAINITCGYHNSFSDCGDEYIDIKEAEETVDFVSLLV